MADEDDYTKMWNGVFTPPQVGDYPPYGGVYILDDEASVGRNTKIYDECTRVLYDDAHPRAYPGGQRYPGPFGAGRASDRVGPTFDEREENARRREGFLGAPPAPPPSEWERDEYTRGSRRLGHPGPRGMVTSSREGRAAVDDVVWDNRPPHFAPDTPNEYAHLYVDPAARGPPLFWSVPGYPGFRQVDRFGGPGAPARCPDRAALELLKVVLFFVVVVLLAMWIIAAGSEKMRLGRQHELVCALRAALAAPRRE